MNEVIDYLARNGTIEVEALYSSPFSSLAPGGPEDIFPESDVDSMVIVIRSIRETATVASQAS